MAAKKGFENETKRDKFVRLAEARTNKIIDMVQLLGNCSNTSQYEYSQKDVDKIFKAIQLELDEARKDLVNRIVRKVVDLLWIKEENYV